MSFSGKVKEELSGIYPRARHCQLAELAALTGMNGLWEEEEGGSLRLILHAENIAVIRKCFTLLEKTFNIKMKLPSRYL